jgi:predicted lipoprotein with Yx(FWY)xxD motif
MNYIALGAALAATTGTVRSAFAQDTIPNFIPVEIALFEDRDASGKKIYKFATDNGHPFYTRDKDEPNKSTCTDECKEDWSPVRARANAKPEAEWTLFDRGNGYMQWVYKGKPVYQNVAQALGQETKIPPGWSELKP